MATRNIRWLKILALSKDNKVWKVLDFRMYLDQAGVGFDIREKSIHKQLILDRIREPKSTELMRLFLKPDDIVLEVGANIGYYVLIESSILSDNGFIYALEPEPDNIDLLKKNISLNNLRNVEVYDLALSNRKGTAKLYTGKASNLHSMYQGQSQEKKSYVEVNTLTLDGFLEDKKPITFLRMDIEGHEVEVIDGMKKTLESPYLERMFIEIHPHVVPSNRMQSFLRTLKNYGFEITYAVSHDNFQRLVLGDCKVEKMSISELIEDERILRRKNAFEVFFEKKLKSL